jgi:hypothetical protein
MARNMTHKYTKTEVWPVVSGVISGAAVTSISAQPAVALTSRGDATKSMVVGPYTVSGIPTGGIGLLTNEATVATDGAFRFPVAGVTAATPKNTLVYSVGAAGAAVTSLTLTAGTNIPFCKIDRFIGETSATEASVWVGRFVDAT